MIKNISLFILLSISTILHAQHKEWALEPQFDKLVRANDHLVYVKKGGKWGIVDNAGKVLAAPQFDSIAYLSPHYALIFQNKRQGVYYFGEQRVCVPPQYDKLQTGGYTNNAICIVEKNGLKGLIDRHNNVLVPCQYKDEIELDWGTKIWYVKHADNKKDSIYKEPKSEIVEKFYQAPPYVFKQMPKPLPMNMNPRPNRPARIFELDRLREEPEKEEFTPPMVAEEKPPLEEEKIYMYQKNVENNRIELFDKDQKPLFEESFYSVSEFGTRFLLLQKVPDGKLALWDVKTQKYKTDFIYTTLMLYTPAKYYLFKRDNKAGFMNDEGDEIMPPTYDEGYIKMFFTVVYKDKKMGLMNGNNDLFLPLEYDDMYLIDNERGAWVFQNGKWGLLRFHW